MLFLILSPLNKLLPNRLTFLLLVLLHLFSCPLSPLILVQFSLLFPIPDHNSILFSLPLVCLLPILFPFFLSSRSVWLYNQANILLIKTFFSSIPWTSILSSSDVNHS